MDFYPYQFAGPIEAYDFGRMAYNIVYLPDDLVSALPLDEHPKLRIEGDVDGIPIKAALMPVRGRWYILINQKNMKRAGKSLGDSVTVQFGIADQDAVDVPSELQDALSDDDAARQVWDSWTPGKQRGWAYRVSSAKTAPTREKRVAEVLEALLNT